MAGNIHLLIIDPQNDFCSKKGALYVPNADKDMNRLSDIIIKYQNHIAGITATFDLHKIFHIAHSIFWIDDKGENPKPFTTITYEDLMVHKFVPSIAAYQKIAEDYLYSLEKSNKYKLCIWPNHCIIGSKGAALYKPLLKALEEYSRHFFNGVNYIFKCSDPFSEQYSVIKQEVDRNSSVVYAARKEIMDITERNDYILVSGEALSHCVANTVLDIAQYNNHDLSKFVLIKDTTSCVEGFEDLGDKFIKQASGMGMQVIDSRDLESFFNKVV